MKFKITKEDGSVEIVEGEYCEEVRGDIWVINRDGSLEEVYRESHELEDIPFWNQFPSQEAAEMEVLRREAMAKRWRPKHRGYYKYFNFSTMDIHSTIWLGNNDDYLLDLLGNCFPLETPDSEIDEYAKAFNYLINQEK